MNTFLNSTDNLPLLGPTFSKKTTFGPDSTASTLHKTFRTNDFLNSYPRFRFELRNYQNAFKNLSADQTKGLMPFAPVSQLSSQSKRIVSRTSFGFFRCTSCTLIQLNAQSFSSLSHHFQQKSWPWKGRVVLPESMQPFNGSSSNISNLPHRWKIIISFLEPVQLFNSSTSASIRRLSERSARSFYIYSSFTHVAFWWLIEFIRNVSVVRNGKSGDFHRRWSDTLFWRIAYSEQFVVL